jgi:hypothetical protein
MQNILNFENGRFSLNDPGSFKRYFWILLFFTLLMMLTGLGQKDLAGADEPRTAGIAAQMAFTGKYVIPALGVSRFLEKPPLYFWATALSFKAFGYSNFTARYPSAVMATLGVMCLYLLLTGMGFSNFSAFFSGFLLAISSQWWASGRTCLYDMMLAGFITASICMFYKMHSSGGLSRKFLWMFGIALAISGAVLTKSLVGLAIPAVTFGAYLFFHDIIKRKISFADWLLTGVAFMLALIPTAIWVYLLCQEVGWQDGGYVVVVHNNFGRFAGSHPDHREAFYYYLTKFPEFIQPITFFIPFAIWYHFRELKKQRSTTSLFLLCWTLVPYLLLTASSAKRQVYLLPLNPAFVALTGVMLAGLIEGTIKLPPVSSYEKLKKFISPVWLEKITTVNILYGLGYILGPATFIVGIVVAVIGIYMKLPGSSTCMLAGAIWVISVTMIFNFSRKRYGVFCTLILLQVLVVFTSIASLEAHKINTTRSFRPMFSAINHLNDQGAKIILYRPWDRIKGAALFYRHKEFTAAGDEETLTKLLKQTPKAVVLFLKEEMPQEGFKSLQEFKIKKDYFVLAVQEQKN